MSCPVRDPEPIRILCVTPDMSLTDRLPVTTMLLRAYRVKAVRPSAPHLRPNRAPAISSG